MQYYSESKQMCFCWWQYYLTWVSNASHDLSAWP